MASAARAAELFCNATSWYFWELSRYGRWPPAAQFVPEGVPGGGALSPISATRIFAGVLMLCCCVVDRFCEMPCAYVRDGGGLLDKDDVLI
jgi:hypothetical protein